MTEQLALEMPTCWQVGDSAWWTYGLGFLCATYKAGGKIRPERGELVKIVNVIIDDTPCGYTNEPRTTYVIYSSEDDREFHVAPRWLSVSESMPCEAVFDAYSRWGN